MKVLDSKRELKNSIRSQINSLVKQYFDLDHKVFKPDLDVVQYSGAIFDESEINAAIEVLLSGWFGLGNKGKLFEDVFSEKFGKPMGLLTNSGSSANLLAVSALRSDHFSDRLEIGDEVITCALGFPTTINPIINNSLVPVFVDAKMGNYNIDVDLLEKAVSSKTRAIFFAHTLGNPVDMEIVMQFVKKHNLILLEDCCDALNSVFAGKKVGSFGRMATCSFYPAHHITTGEGGFVAVENQDDFRIVESLRSWGRGCYCYGKTSLMADGLCKRRFSKWLEDVDVVMDHKYVYSEIGYNLKPLELQAAIGLEQVKKLPLLTKSRKENFAKLYSFFANYDEFFILPQSHPLSDVSWFSFPLTIKKDAPFKRMDFVSYLEKRKIQTRNLFAGNILRHPAYKNIKCRVVGSLEVSDTVLTDSFFLGVYHGITEEMMEHVISASKEFLDKYRQAYNKGF